MMLAFDIGNSATKFAVFDGDRVVTAGAIAGSARGAAVGTTAFASELGAVLRSRETINGIDRAGAVSVVPEGTRVLANAVRETLGLELEVFTSASSSPLRNAYRTPETLGADRLAAAVAGWIRYGREGEHEARNVFVIDAGTTTTCEVVSREGVYRGGMIAPGPGLMRMALNEGTAQLPLVDLIIPDGPVGASTDEAMRAGILYGYLGSVEGMIARLKSDLPGPLYVAATGGWAVWLAERLAGVDLVEPHLVLHGVRLMMEFAPGGK